MKTNILIIGNSIAFTGAFNAALRQAKLLNDIGNFVFLIPTGSTNHNILTKEGFHVYTLPMIEISRSWRKNLLYFPVLFINYFRLRSIVEKEKIEIIQVNDFYNLLGALLKIFGYKGKLITYVRFLPSSLPNVLRRIWTWLAWKYSYRVICVSDAVKMQMPKKENIIRIYNPGTLEEKYGEFTSAEKVKLLYPANYILGKGQGIAIEAFALAYKKNKNLLLKFVGGDMGLEKNKDKKNRLMKRVVQLKIEQVVEFADFSSDIEKEIKESDIILNFSKSESFSMTCLEASFYGKPVIATRCGGPEEIIVDGQTGILVKNKSVEEMADAILQLAGDKGKRNQFGNSGRQYVRRKFNVESFRKEFERILCD